MLHAQGIGEVKEPSQPLQEISEADLELMAYYFYLERIGSGAQGDAQGDWDAAGAYMAAAEASAPRVDVRVGVVYPKRPEDFDALTRIDGLDAGDEAYLNGRGIYRFAQIASWTPEIVAAFETLAEKIRAADWVGQARALVIGRQVAA